MGLVGVSSGSKTGSGSFVSSGGVVGKRRSGAGAPGPGLRGRVVSKAIAATVGLIMPGLPSVLDHEDVRRRAEWPTPPRAPSPAR